MRGGRRVATAHRAADRRPVRARPLHGTAPRLGRVHPLTRTVIARSPQRLRRPVALTARTVDSALADRAPGLAAEIAFWTLLSLPALLLATIATLGLVAGDDAAGWQAELIDRIVEVASVALTSQAIESALRPALEQLVEGAAISVASLGFVATVWTASRAVKVVLQTIALAYGQDAPSGVGDRILGFALTIIGLVLGLVLLPLLVAGPGFGEQLGGWVGTEQDLLATLWRVSYWPAAVALVTLVIASLYHVGSPLATRFRRDLPGAVLATGVWLAGSAGLRLYGTWILGTDSIYGPLAGPIVGLLWLWLTGFAVLLGAELNAQIEHLWPSEPHATGSQLKRGLQSLTTTARLTFDHRDVSPSGLGEPEDEPRPEPE
ncbi:YihY/virulence factor BrkB family protein [Nitriliruptoraceae bacterium ZYF776]|nr:YihY/virulence factor BrkB family protein [Profundirhabdus halotolerans]